MLVYVTGRIPGVFIDYFVRFQVDFLFTSYLVQDLTKHLEIKPMNLLPRLKKKVSNLTLFLTPHLSWEGCVRLASRDLARFNGLEEGKERGKQKQRY